MNDLTHFYKLGLSACSLGLSIGDVLQYDSKFYNEVIHCSAREQDYFLAGLMGKDIPIELVQAQIVIRPEPKTIEAPPEPVQTQIELVEEKPAESMSINDLVVLLLKRLEQPIIINTPKPIREVQDINRSDEGITNTVTRIEYE